MGIVQEAIVWGVIVWKAIARGWGGGGGGIVLGENGLGGNCPRWKLSRGLKT